MSIYKGKPAQHKAAIFEKIAAFHFLGNITQLSSERKTLDIFTLPCYAVLMNDVPEGKS